MYSEEGIKSSDKAGRQGLREVADDFMLEKCGEREAEG